MVYGVKVVIRQKQGLKFNVSYFKKDMVFTISLILAAASCLIQPPKLESIDFKVLISLFNLMLTIKAFEELKLLDKFAISLLNQCNNRRSISSILILLCLVSSMFVTNDVALITFVPLTLIISKKTNINMMDTIILQTIAANIGSSLTPMGNPQNLFLYSHYGLKPMPFFMTILLLAILGIGSLYLTMKKLHKGKLKVALAPIQAGNRNKTVVWFIIFAIIIVSIFGAISFQLAFIITMMTAIIVNRKLLLQIDYQLLLTFICFFIFIGNISSTDVVQRIASESMKNSTSVYFSSIFISQLISNVPAAILLSNFTTDWKPLLLGVNVGGLGTIIASLASVISFKLYNQAYPKESKKYLIKFTLYNFSFLALLSIIQYLILKGLKIF